LLDKERVPVTLVYRADVYGAGDSPVRLTLRSKNRAADGLGLPLPAGKLSLYQRGAAREFLIGEGSVGDKAVGEDVEIDVATWTGITARDVEAKRGLHALTLTNDNRYPVAVEAKLGDRSLSNLTGTVRKRDGTWLWAVVVPANGTVTLGYRIRSD